MNITPGPLSADDKDVLKDYTEIGDGLLWGGTLKDDDLVTTFRLDRKGKTVMIPTKAGNRTYIVYQPQGEHTAYTAEAYIMGAAYDAASPRKFLRVHLLGQRGNRVLTGEAAICPYDVGREDGEFHRQVHVLKNPGEKASSLFASIWEPYAGTPVIKTIKMEGDSSNADSPVAVHVETVDGIKDLCFADAASNQLRTLGDGTKVQADFAYLSQDEEGLRHASIVGGTILQSPLITVKAAAARYEATMTDVDYLNKTATLDKPFPAKLLNGLFFEVGLPAQGGHDGHWTNYEAVSVKPDGGKTTLVWRKGADVYSGKVTEVTPGENGGTVKLYLTPVVLPGRTTNSFSRMTAWTSGGAATWRRSRITAARTSSAAC